jgi:hypothetical protein
MDVANLAAEIARLEKKRDGYVRELSKPWVAGRTRKQAECAKLTVQLLKLYRLAEHEGIEDEREGDEAIIASDPAPDNEQTVPFWKRDQYA